MSCCSGSEEAVAKAPNEVYAKLRFKITIVGDSGVGKTSLLLKYIGEDTDGVRPTIGASFITAKPLHHTNIDNAIRYKIECQFWDTAGQERFHSLAPMYLRGSSLVIVAFSVNDAESFANVRDWVERIKAVCPDNTPIVLAGCKADLKNDSGNTIPEDQVLSTYNYEYVETSAHTGYNVNALFHRVAYVLYDLYKNVAAVSGSAIKEV